MPVTDRWTQFLTFIRGSVRPLVTYAVIGVLCAITFKLVQDFANEQIAQMVLGAFIALVSVLSAFWFADRKKTQ